MSHTQRDRDLYVRNVYDKNIMGKVNAEWYNEISSCPKWGKSPKGSHGYNMGFAGDFDGLDINEFAKGSLKIKYTQKLQNKLCASSLILNIQPKGGIIA